MKPEIKRQIWIWGFMIFLGILIILIINMTNNSEQTTKIGESINKIIGKDTAAITISPHNTTGIYPDLYINNSGTIVAILRLQENTDRCITNCYAIINATTFMTLALPKNFDFEDGKKRGRTLPYNIYFGTPAKMNITAQNITAHNCTNITEGNLILNNCTYTTNYYQKTINFTNWTAYDGGNKPAGNYLIKITATKDAKEDIDWSFGYNGMASSTIREYWAYWNSSLENGLVSWWTLNQSGSSLPDVFGRNAMYSTATVKAGISNNSRDSENNNAYYSENLSMVGTNGSTDMSVCFWANVTAAAQYDSFVAIRNAGVTWNYWTYFSSATVLSSTPSGTTPQNTFDYTNNFGRYTHICSILNHSTIYLYINGTLVDTDQITQAWTGGFLITIGNDRSDSRSRPINGWIDEVGFWNRTLTASEISDLYNNSGFLGYNWTEPVAPVTTYPTFYNDTSSDGLSYLAGQSYLFNVTIVNVNTTAGLNFNGVNYSMSNTTIYFNASVVDLSAGTYPYYFWAYGTAGYNQSGLKNMTVNKKPVTNFLSVSGSNVSFANNISSCLQEYANVSTACGGLSTGRYSPNSSNGELVNFSTPYQFVDGNYTNGAFINGTQDVFFYINYTKPSSALSAIWQIADSGGIRNVTIPNDCFNNGNNELVLKTISSYDIPRAVWQCNNNTAWRNLSSYSQKYIYEEGIYWNIENTYTTTYGFNFTATCTQTDSLPGLQFLLSGTDFSAYNGVSTLIGAGSYNLNCTLSETQNYSAAESTALLNILKASNSVTLTLNGTANNITTIYGDNITITATGTNGTVKVFQDGTEITNGAGYVLGVGYYNITANNTGNQNYSTATKTLFLNITKATPILSLAITPASLVVYPNETTATGSGCPTELTCSLFRNDTAGAIANPNVTTYPEGQLVYTYNTSGNANYTNASATATLTVTATPLIYPTYSNIVNPTTPQTFASGASYSFSIDWADELDVYFEFDGRNISPTKSGVTYNVTLVDLGVAGHTYLWWANSSDGSQNFTTTYLLNITKRTPVGSLAISPSGTLTYPTSTTATATETNAKDSDVTYRLYLDGSLVANPHTTNLSVGSHTYIFNTTGGMNYTSATLDTESITIINSSITELEQTYNGVVYQSSIQSYVLNMTYDTSTYTLLTAGFIYTSNTSGVLNYTGTITTNSAGALVNTNLTIPLDAPYTNYFYWNLTFTNGTTFIYFTSSVALQNVTSVIFGACNETNNITTMNFTIYDTLNPTKLVNSSFKATISYWTSGGSYKTNFSYQDLNGNTSNFRLCFSSANSSLYVDGDFQFYGTGYTYNNHYYRNALLTSTSTNQLLYLLNDGNSTATEVSVINEYQAAQPNKFVIIQLYDIGTGTYKTVSMAKTNYNGKDLFYANWYNSFYKFIVIDSDGSTALANFNPTKISSTPQTLPISSTFTFDWKKFEDVQYTLYYNNATQSVILTFIDPNGLIASGCLKVSKMSGKYQNLYDACVNSTSGTLFYNLAGINGTIYATFYATGSAADVSTIEILKDIQNEIYDTLDKKDAAIYGFIFVGVAFFVGLFSPVGAIIMTLGGVVAATGFGFIPNTLTNYLFVGIAIIGIYIAWKLRN